MEHRGSPQRSSRSRESSSRACPMNLCCHGRPRLPLAVVGALTAVLVWAWSPGAFADDTQLARAQSLADNGAAAAAHGEYERARQDFEEAYKLTKHAALLLGLGDAQLRTGRFAEAANSFQRYLASSLNLSAAQRALAEKSLQKALKHCAGLILSSNISEPAIYVDGILIDDAQPSVPQYVAPGEHIVLLRRLGYLDASDTVVVGPGEVKTVRFSLAAEPPPLIVAQPASPSSHETSPVRQATRAEQANSPNGARTAVLIGGSAATALSGGISAYFYFRGRSYDSDAVNIRTQLPNDGACAPVLAGYEQRCGTLASTLDDRTAAFKNAQRFFITTGVLAAGTLSVFLFWPKRDPANSQAVSVVPWGPDGAGLTVFGHFGAEGM